MDHDLIALITGNQTAQISLCPQKFIAGPLLSELITVIYTEPGSQEGLAGGILHWSQEICFVTSGQSSYPWSQLSTGRGSAQGRDCLSLGAWARGSDLSWPLHVLLSANNKHVGIIMPSSYGTVKRRLFPFSIPYSCCSIATR